MNFQNKEKDDLVRQWLEKAHRDIFAAESLISHGEYVSGIVAFHAQQAAEKYIKALLVHEQIEFTKTHNIELLLKLVLKINKKLPDLLKDTIILTDYGVDVRYPDDLPNLTLEEAKQAVELAKKVRDAILGELPKLENK